MTAAGSVLPDAHPADREIDVILNDEQIRRGRVRILNERRDGLARKVHVGLRLAEDDGLPGKRPLRPQTLELTLLLPVRANLRGDRIDRLKTNRVRRIGVLDAGIP